MQTFMIGIGGSLGFLIASVDWLQKYPQLEAIAPSSLHVQFYLCGLIYLVAILCTVFSTPEEPPADLHAPKTSGETSLSLGHWASEMKTCLLEMPAPMKRLAWVQIFTWIGLFCMWIFYSVAVAHHVFGATDPHSPLYDKGVAAANSSMSIYQMVSTGFALCIPLLAKKISRVMIHTIGLTCAGLSLISIWFIKDPALLVLPMIGVGIGWATILSMPYALLVDFIPKERYGIYMGIFNMFIVLPEIISSLFLGWVMQHVFNNNHMLAIALGGGFMLIAAILVQSLRQFEGQEPPVKESEQDARPAIQVVGTV